MCNLRIPYRCWLRSRQTIGEWISIAFRLAMTSAPTTLSNSMYGVSLCRRYAHRHRYKPAPTELARSNQHLICSFEAVSRTVVAVQQIDVKTRSVVESEQQDGKIKAAGRMGLHGIGWRWDWCKIRWTFLDCILGKRGD